MRLPLLAQLLAILMLNLAGQTAQAQTQVYLTITTDVSTEAGGVALGETTVAELRAPPGTWRVVTDLRGLLPPGVGIDALDLVARGVVFSTDGPFISGGGLAVEDEDLVLLEHGVLSIVLDGSVIGIRSDADLDAVAVVSLAPLDLYFSVDVPVSIGGTVYSDDDIMRLHVDTVSLAVAGATLLGDEAKRADLDALAIDPASGHFLFSTDVTITDIGGLERAEDEDVVEFTGSGLVLRSDLTAWGLDGERVDVRALVWSPTLFADGFESGSTGAWSATQP
jgi:hypothetical protein